MKKLISIFLVLVMTFALVGTASAEGTPTFVVSEETAAPGEEVRVKVNIVNNPGIASASLSVDYDHNVLELTNVEQGEYTTGQWLAMQPNYDAGWVYYINDYHDGLFATLIFKVKTDAPAGDTAVTVTYKPNFVFDENEDNVHFDIQPGKVTVIQPETAYYLIGSMTDWQVNEDYKFVENPNSTGEYMLETTLAVGDEFKAVSATGTTTNTWYPDGMDNNYIVDAAHSGNVTVYFRPDYTGGDDWHYHCLYIAAQIQDEPEFKSQSLLLSGEIGVRFYVYLPQNDGYVYEGVDFTISGKNGKASSVPFSSDLPTNTKGYYGFTYYVNTIQMADTITATLHYLENGREKKLEKTYAVVDYFEAFDAAVNARPEAYAEETVSMIRATADYGHYVQAYLDECRPGWSVPQDHKAIRKVYRTYTETNLLEAVAEAERHAPILSGRCPDVTNLSYKLDLENMTSIRLIVTVKAGFSGTLTAAVDGKPCAVTRQTDTKYAIEIPNVQAHQLSRKFIIAVTTQSGTLTLIGSGLSYVRIMLENANGSATVRNAAIALYRLSKLAEAVKSSGK